MEREKIQLMLTDCKKCRILPVIRRVVEDGAERVRIECPKCGAAVVSKLGSVGRIWNSIHKDKEKEPVARTGGDKWDVTDYRPDPLALSDDLSYNSSAADDDVFEQL
ncbi:MAG: hypothetical protein MJZ17_05420 [Bacteroidales bacterium]|nr:hypothetical protein [Bacteroidales bacterium]